MISEYFDENWSCFEDIRAGTLSLLNKDKDLQISLYLGFFGSIYRIEFGDSENVHFIGLYPTLFEDKVGLKWLEFGI